MKKFLKLFVLFLTFGIFANCGSSHKEHVLPPIPEPVAPEKATIIYLVRHAEKGTNSATDPDLSVAGKARAEILKDSLANKNISAVYATNYKRTMQTGAPAALAKNLTVVQYDPNNLAALATKVLKDNLNQTVLIVGHSNTVLETIEAFKAKRPVPVINESEYNYLFKVTLKENKDPEVEVKRYGN